MRHAVIGSLAVGALLLTAPAALASPPAGCPAGFESWDVSAEPYQADNAVDEEGNGDGTVCARALGAGASRSYGVDGPIYVFRDNA